MDSCIGVGGVVSDEIGLHIMRVRTSYISQGPLCSRCNIILTVKDRAYSELMRVILLYICVNQFLWAEYVR